MLPRAIRRRRVRVLEAERHSVVAVDGGQKAIWRRIGGRNCFGFRGRSVTEQAFKTP